MKADILLCSNSIFTAKKNDTAPFPGIVAIAGNKIVAVDTLSSKDAWIGEDTVVYELGDALICPGFIDNHVFFTGFVWTRLGVDLSGAGSKREAALILLEHAKKTQEEKVVFGHGLRDEICEEDDDVTDLLSLPGNRRAVGFTEGRCGCIMNRAAKEYYNLDENEIYAEACYKVFDEYLKEEAFILKQYEAFSNLLASRGITSIKEIGFDRYSGFAKILKKLEDSRFLKHRVNLVSQPVGFKIDYSYAKESDEFFDGDFVQFIGFNIMVDGEIAQGNADLLEPYENTAYHCKNDVDYETIRRDVLEADRLGYRCALHAEGDKAVRKCIDIFEECSNVNGKRDSRHMIIDLELTHPDDLRRMGKLGITANNYVQIMDCIGDYEDFYGRDCVGEKRLENYWAYRSMLEHGVILCCGTDLPLTVPDIPLSVYFAVSRKYLSGQPSGGINTKDALRIDEILKAWTIGGQYANFREETLGTIETGKLADIAVLNRNLFNIEIAELPAVKAVLTICDGKVVYENLLTKSSL